MKFTHKPDCAYPLLTRYVGRFGDPLERCRTCGAWSVVPTTAPVAARPEPATVPAPVVVPVAVVAPVVADEEGGAIISRYRCAHHQDTPVDWRGRGCTPCHRAAAKRARKAAEKARQGAER